MDELDEFSDELEESFTRIPEHLLPGQLESEDESLSPTDSPRKKAQRREAEDSE